jgi:serine/threonine-protein phosphatase PPG1
VVKKFLELNNMNHILRAHQLCMEGYSVMYEDRLSTVWSAPNVRGLPHVGCAHAQVQYCYRCGNAASILEVGPGGTKHFNVFDAAPENERDGPVQQQQAAQQQRVRFLRFLTNRPESSTV